MFKRGLLALLVGGLLGAGLWLGAPSPAKAQGPDPDRFYHYPYYYFEHSYWPNQTRWPDPRVPFQRAPAYQAYPPYLDPNFNYPLFESKRYYRGHHFFLDQF